MMGRSNLKQRGCDRRSPMKNNVVKKREIGTKKKKICTEVPSSVKNNSMIDIEFKENNRAIRVDDDRISHGRVDEVILAAMLRVTPRSNL